MTNLMSQEAYDNHMASRAAAIEDFMNEVNRVYNEAGNILADGMSNGEPLDYIIAAWPETIEEFTLRAIVLQIECWFVEYRRWDLERQRQARYQQSLQGTELEIPF
jgi:hypothetical protein